MRACVKPLKKRISAYCVRAENPSRIVASLAQLVERVAVNHKVIGSSPVGSVIIIFYYLINAKVIKTIKNNFKIYQLHTCMHLLHNPNPNPNPNPNQCPTVYGNAFAVAVARDTINAANPRRCT